MKFALRTPMLISARVEGRYGAVRELSSLLDFNAPYCSILSRDAIDLGYPEGGNKHQDQERLTPERVPRFTGMQGIQRGILVTLDKVSVGSVVATKIEAVVMELGTPPFITFDFILGRSFLKHCKLTIDVNKGYVTIV